MALKSECIEFFNEKNILVNPSFFENTPENFNPSHFYKKCLIKFKEVPFCLNNDIYLMVENLEAIPEINWLEFEKSFVQVEKGKTQIIYNSFLDILNFNITEEQKEVLAGLSKEGVLPLEEIKEITKEDNFNVIVVKSYEDFVKKREVSDFVTYFRNRYNTLKKILMSRQELSNVYSINKLYGKTDKEVIAVIGIVVDKSITKNKNIMLTLEDPTGIIKVLINNNRPELHAIATDIVNDEVIGITGAIGNKIIFCNDILFPDVPLNKEFKKAKDEVYAVFISDVHVGLKNFLHNDLLNFIKWTRGEYGNDKQREIASKLKYLFVVGDLVEGVGIYPDQEKELEIKDVYQQYEKAVELLSQVPKNIKVIICGGNHDAMRIDEPQPPFDPEIIKSLKMLTNVIFVSNPALINIQSSEDFPGFDVLMYHGFSYIYYAENVPSIRAAGGVHRCDLIMKYLLQKRHLAPAHTSTLYIPDIRYDPLVIDKVPDIFVSGHIHKSSHGNYRNVTTINCSCWTSQTEFQEKMGITPDPCKIPLINLKTREVKIMNFLSGDENGNV